ncbi:unnamed protein product [Amaranthus hypochondriacus]
MVATPIWLEDPIIERIRADDNGFLGDQSFDPMVEFAEQLIVQTSNIQKLAPPNGCSSRKTRGRPKRINPSTPSTNSTANPYSVSLLEAQETWKMAKKLGVTSEDENEVISQLRRSKRILNMEEACS